MNRINRDQIAVMNIQYKYFPLTRFLDDAVKYEVKNVELWGAAPHFHLEDMTYRQVSGVRREIDSRGLKLVCFTPEPVSYTHLSQVPPCEESGWYPEPSAPRGCYGCCFGRQCSEILRIGGLG